MSCGMTTKNDDDVGHALVLISHRENMCALLKHGRHGELTLCVNLKTFFFHPPVLHFLHASSSFA